MLDNIIDKNIMFIQNHGVKIDGDEDKAVYKYGMQILYYYIIDLAVIFSFAAVFGKLYETAVMAFIFALFQVFGGGYHAKTALRCLLAMIAGAALGNILIIIFAGHPALNIALAVVSSSIILILTPVANKKHPVSKKIKQRSKLIIRLAVILILTVIIISAYFDKTVITAAISVTTGLYLISLIIAKIKK